MLDFFGNLVCDPCIRLDCSSSITGAKILIDIQLRLCMKNQILDVGRRHLELISHGYIVKPTQKLYANISIDG